VFGSKSGDPEIHLLLFQHARAPRGIAGADRDPHPRRSPLNAGDERGHQPIT